MTPQQGCDIIYERIKAFAEIQSENKITHQCGHHVILGCDKK